MKLSEKIAGANKLIREVMRIARNPAIMCSFGKDSMVVLHLVRQLGYELPVIFHKEPFMPRKYRFSRKVINLWNLTVYDFPPLSTAVQETRDDFEVVNYYPAGARPLVLPTGTYAPAPKEAALCGLHDLYLKPTGTFNYPWDVVFHGHKSTDHDPIYGAVPLAADFARNLDSGSPAFPIRHFTDEDVWSYHELHQLPIHEERYEKTSAGWQERADKTHNPDYFPACTACMQKGRGAVPCPRIGGAMTMNVSAQLRQATREQLPYLQSEPVTP